MYACHGFVVAHTDVRRLAEPLQSLVALAAAVTRIKYRRHVAALGEHLLWAMTNPVAPQDTTVQAHDGGLVAGGSFPLADTATRAVSTAKTPIGATQIGVALTASPSIPRRQPSVHAQQLVRAGAIGERGASVLACAVKRGPAVAGQR